MRKYLSLLTIVALCCGFLMGCNGTITEPEPITPPDITEPTEPTGETEPNNSEPQTEKPYMPDVETSKLSKMELDSYILDTSYAKTGANTMFSPLSLDMALGMVAEGAGSEYHNLFPRLLGKDNYADFAGQYMERVDELNVESNFEYNKYKTVFEIANSIWINNQSSPLSSYIQKVNSFNPELQNVNFADTEKIVADINTWCKIKTHDMIEQVVTENSFTPNSKTVLVNAIYFESPWLEPWNISNDKTFYCFDETKEVKMIETVTPYYYENDKATAFGAVYKNGLLFIGILPKDNGEFTVSELNIKELLDSQTMDYDVTAKMPAFKFDNEVEGLVEALKDTGYGILFDSSVCMFSQMLENEPLFISDIIQIDAIEVDENGTKAAAATAVIMDKNSAIMEEPKTKDVVLDRPFVFLIYDPVMEQIVFLGKVVDPA